jgi:hypothetical protein
MQPITPFQKLLLAKKNTKQTTPKTDKQVAVEFIATAGIVFAAVVGAVALVNKLGNDDESED